jgi:ankyrin repeat protein
LLRLTPSNGKPLLNANTVREDTMGKDDATTDLFEAAVSGNVQNARAALASWADVNAVDVNGRTPLHFAAGNGSVAVAQLLIDAGADPNAKDNFQETPLDWAAKYPRAGIAEVLEAAVKRQQGHTAQVKQRRGTGKRKID